LDGDGPAGHQKQGLLDHGAEAVLQPGQASGAEDADGERALTRLDHTRAEQPRVECFAGQATFQLNQGVGPEAVGRIVDHFAITSDLAGSGPLLRPKRRTE